VKQSAAFLAGASLCLFPPTAAWADGAGGPAGASCGEAYTNAQTFRNARKLVQARDALRICAQPTCKDFIVKDCVEWLDQVQQSLPTVVPVATDPQGNALFDVKVSVDGAVFVAKIDGRSVEIDPGPHTFAFEGADGTKAEKQILVTEGEHDKRVAVTLGTGPATPAAAPAPAPAPAPAAGAPETPAAGSPAPIVVNASGGGLQWQAIGLANAGVGVAALAVGSVFGGIAISKKNSSGCTSTGACPNTTDEQSWRDAGTAATASTILFVAGGVLTAGGIAMWVLAPSSSVQITPAVGVNGGGALVRGVW
jgi:hypothetical protein